MTPLRQMNAPENPHLPKDLKELGDLAHLLFEWPIRQAPRLALPGCILVAAIIQAGMIVLFSISYTTPSDVQPASPQIYFIPPDSATARQIAPWLAANDPAIFSPQYDTRDALPAPPPLKYRPSYEEPPPPLRPLPVEATRPVEPPALPQMADILRTASAALPAATSTPTLRTVVHWQDELAGRALRSPASAPLPVALSPSAQPALYEVEVSPEGIPMHSVVLNSSGDPGSDEVGNVWIHAQRFQSGDQSSWGRVLLLWGASNPAATPQSTTKP